PAVDGDGWNIVDVDDRDDLKQDEVPSPESARHRVAGVHRYLSKATRPATSVIFTVSCGSCSGDSASGLPERTARSAHFPASMLPRFISSPAAIAPPLVYA